VVLTRVNELLGEPAVVFAAEVQTPMHSSAAWVVVTDPVVDRDEEAAVDGVDVRSRSWSEGMSPEYSASVSVALVVTPANVKLPVAVWDGAPG
jgi:hypothetical protein